MVVVGKRLSGELMASPPGAGAGRLGQAKRGQNAGLKTAWEGGISR